MSFFFLLISNSFSSPIQGGVDAKELFHLYIMIWIQDRRLSLLESCKLDKVFILNSLCRFLLSLVFKSNQWRSKIIFTNMCNFTLIWNKKLKLETNGDLISLWIAGCGFCSGFLHYSTDPYFFIVSFLSAYGILLRSWLLCIITNPVIQAGKMVWSQNAAFNNPISWWNVHQADWDHSRISSYHFQMARIYLCSRECKFSCSLILFDTS